ncbi:unnamed protein product, partial [Brachionus calyciflorus]
PAPQQQPSYQPAYQQPAPQQSYEAVPQQSVEVAPQQPVYQQPAPQQSYEAPKGYENKPFTAVFIPGRPTQFKLGTPGDFGSGSYTSI